MEARALAALLLVLLLASPAIAADRVDVYSKDVQRQGWAVVNERTGRLDLYLRTASASAMDRSAISTSTSSTRI